MAFTLPDLPYAHDALASLGMSKETFEYHHDIHHKAYVDNGNKLIAGTEWEGKSLEDIVRGTYNAGAVAQNGIFNNASQHWNHNLFWEVMGPGEDKKMPGALDKALVEAFGSVAKFKEDFAAAGAGQFGSGWCWLVKDKDGALKVTKTENGVNPLCFGQTALLGCVQRFPRTFLIGTTNFAHDLLHVFGQAGHRARVHSQGIDGHRAKANQRVVWRRLIELVAKIGRWEHQPAVIHTGLQRQVTVRQG